MLSSLITYKKSVKGVRIRKRKKMTAEDFEDAKKVGHFRTKDIKQKDKE